MKPRRFDLVCVRCNECGTPFTVGGRKAAKELKRHLTQYGWLYTKGKIYCPDCMPWEETENVDTPF